MYVYSKMVDCLCLASPRGSLCYITNANIKGLVNFKSTLPNTYTNVLGRSLMKQLRDNWRSSSIVMTLAKATTRSLLLKLVDFEKKLDTAWLAEISCDVEFTEEGVEEENAEQDYEFTLLKEMKEIHRDNHRTALVKGRTALSSEEGVKEREGANLRACRSTMMDGKERHCSPTIVDNR